MYTKKRYKWKGYVAVFIAAVLLISQGGTSASVVKAATGAATHNIHHEDYYEDNGNWASNVKSYLYQNRDGSITRVEEVNSSIVIETYDGTTFALQNSKTLSLELPVFGGFYAGNDYNYIVYGQTNVSENSASEVFKLVQYNKDWSKVRSAGLSDINTTIPFHAGSLRFCEYQDMIYVRTAHKMYRSNDGLNHQANVTFSFNETTGKLTTAYMGNMNLTDIGCLNQSYNQFIKMDMGQLLALDHGAYSPRGIILTRYNAPANGNIFTDSCSVVQISSFAGNEGEEYTGASVGGFEVSNNNYLVAYQSVNQTNDFHGNVRNIYLGKVSRSNFTQSNVQNEQITYNASNEPYSVSNPILVKVSDNSFVMLWERYDLSKASASNPDGKGTDMLQYIKLDGSGNRTEGIQTVTGSLSDCQPIVSGNKIIWYVTNNSLPKFYVLDLTTNRMEIKDTASITSASPSVSVSPSASPSMTPGVTPGPTGTPKPITTPRPTATPYPPYDEVVPDDSDLEINDEVGPDNPSLDEINSSATEETEKNEGNEEDDDTEAPVSVPEKGAYISSSSARYIVTVSDDTFGTVEYLKPMNYSASVKVPATVTVDGITYDVTSIADGAFKNNMKVTKVTIGNNVTKIGKNAFNGCTNLKNISLGTSIKNIGAKAFYNCRKLSKLTVPSSVTKIGKQSFAGCKKLKNMVFRTTSLTLSKVGNKAFTGIPQNAVIKVPKSKVTAYKTIFRKKGLAVKIKVKKNKKDKK